MDGWFNSRYPNKQEYEKSMRMGGLRRNSMYTNKEDIDSEPEEIKGIFRELMYPESLYDIRSCYFVGGTKMKEVLYKSVLFARFQSDTAAYVLTQSSLHSICDVILGKPIRSPVGYATKTIIESIIDTSGLVCVTDFVKSTSKEQPITPKEQSIIEDYFEYRLDEGYPTFLHSAYSLRNLTDVFSKSFVTMLNHQYVELKQEELYD